VRPTFYLLLLSSVLALPAVAACGSGNDDSMDGTHAGAPVTHTVSTSADGGIAHGDAGAGGASEGGAAPLTATFTLIDTVVTDDPNGSPLPGFDPILDGTVINLALTGQLVSLRADLPANAVVGSAVFVLDGSYVNADDTEPFTMCGSDATTDASAFAPCPLTDGKHDLTLTLYAPQSAGGQLVSVTQFQFSITSSDYDGGVFDPDAADASDEDGS
jgi:hypothetical protein